MKRTFIQILIFLFLGILSVTCHYHLYAQKVITGRSPVYTFSIGSANKISPQIEITLISPELKRGFKNISQESSIELIGKVNSLASLKEVSVNGQKVSFFEDNIFKHQVFLNKGENVITISARDKNDQLKEVKYQIYNREINHESGLSVFTEENQFHALIIGVEDYEDPQISDLDNPVRDAKKLLHVLTSNYSFASANTKLLINPNRADIINSLDSLAEKLDKDDNLLIFYAGHGFWDKEKETGFWLPSDARKNSTANWFRNSTLSDYIAGIKTKHTLLIADACFSGSIFKTRKAFADAPYAIHKLYNLPSRKAMTSGALEEVPDKSVFAKYLIKRLEENTEKYLSSETLFSGFRTAVLNNSPNVPRFGEIQNAGDEGGDFIFVRKE